MMLPFLLVAEGFHANRWKHLGHERAEECTALRTLFFRCIQEANEDVAKDLEQNMRQGRASASHAVTTEDVSL